MQIEFPDIYEALVQKADIWKWDNKFAYDITGGEELSGEGSSSDLTRTEENFIQISICDRTKIRSSQGKNFKGLDKNKNPDFNEVWELVLFKICYPRPRYRARVIEISRFISHLLEKVLTENENKKKIAKLEEVLRTTSITSVVVQVQLHKQKIQKYLMKINIIP